MLVKYQRKRLNVLLGPGIYRTTPLDLSFAWYLTAPLRARVHRLTTSYCRTPTKLACSLVNFCVLGAELWPPKETLSQCSTRFVSFRKTTIVCVFFGSPMRISMRSPKYQILVHLFRATSCPSVCGFALRQCAVDNLTCAEANVIESVMENFYLDDFLASFKSINEATMLVQAIRELLGECRVSSYKVW